MKILPVSFYVPTPLVPWQTVVCVFEPTGEPTRSRYRSLKRNGRATDGVTAAARSESGFAGSQTVHSVLNVIAIHMRRDGETAIADDLVRRAAKLESDFKEPLKDFLAVCTIDALPQSAFYSDLVGATARELLNVADWSKHVYASGAITSVGHSFAHLDGHLNNGLDAAVDLPRQILDGWRLVAGDYVFVFQRMMQHAVIIEVLPIAKPPESASLGYIDAIMWPQRDAAEVGRLESLMGSRSIGRRSLRPAG